MTTALRMAPALQVSQWFNVAAPPDAQSLRGKVVVLHAFQMLCPGCVRMSTPQAQRLHEFFPASAVAVIGLHTVFENHDAMTPAALAAFIQEHRLTFPIGIDSPDDTHGIPLTMRAFALEGTPSLVLIDRLGRIRMKRFGHVPDLHLGAAVATLQHEQTEPVP